VRSKPDPGAIREMESLLAGHFVAQCLYAAAVLGIPDLIAGGETTSGALARATGCHQPFLERLLGTLASRAVLAEMPDGSFALTQLGKTLRSDVPGSLRHKASFEISPPVWSAMGGLLGTLRDGEPAFSGIHDATIYQYLAAHADLAAVFHDFMTAQSALHNEAIVEAYDFSGIRTLVDVGGGHGATLAAILRRYPEMRGVLFDLPEVAAGAAFDPPDLAARCAVHGGDMMASVPAGADAYLIKRVMMDKTDRDAVTVLRNCLEAMEKGGRILLIDPMLPEPNVPHVNRTADILMMVITEGKCRSREQFQALFDAAGLTLSRVVSTGSPNAILEGVRG